jgi:uncharacterized protein
MKKARCSGGVIDHCLNVTRVALRIAEALRNKGIKVDVNLVEVGALLHDIGRGQTHNLDHGAVGGQIAVKIGLPTEIVNIIERHVGAGLTMDEALRNGLPNRSFIPETLEEKIVCYADKLVEGDHEIDIEVTLDQYSQELGRDHPSIKRLQTLHDEIIGLLTK